jgi:hypothetical protein
MHKIGIVIFSSMEGAGHSAVYRALMFAEELQRAGDDVAIIFDGEGTTALAAVLDPAHDTHRAWIKAAKALRGACDYCAKAYDVKEKLEAAAIPMLVEDRGHASLRAFLNEGRQIVTF